MSTDRANHQPACLAPFTAVLIDTDKGVRPCCSYVGNHEPGTLGVARLREGGPSLREILAGPAWREIQRETSAGGVPPGCATCVRREQDTGFALRRDYDDPDWRAGITYLEVNTSNVCTLQCRACNSHFSHRWSLSIGGPIHKPAGSLLQQSLDGIDLSRLNRVSFKGGEPMLNADVPAVLEHLASIGRLDQVAVSFVSNATIVQPELIELLRGAKSCHIALSMDGVGDVQTYIRHGDSQIENIERFVREFAAVGEISFRALPTVMVYNVFALDDIHRWWTGLTTRVAARFDPLRFYNFVVSPAHLSVMCLQDATRQRLAARYESLDPELYQRVVQTLRLPFAGAATHDALVRTTLETDRMLGKSVFDAVPELAEEMRLLDPRAELSRVHMQVVAGRLAEAEQALETVARCTAPSAGLGLHRALLQAARGENLLALATADAAARLPAEGDDADRLRSLRVELLQRIDRTDEADREAEAWLERAPDAAAALVAAAAIRLRQARPTEAATLAARARASAGARPTDQIAALRVERAARRAAGQGARADALDAELRTTLGRALDDAARLHAEGDIGTALAACIVILPDVEKPFDATLAMPLWDLLTELYMHIGAYSQALELLDRALAIHPGHPDALVRRGVVLARSGMTEAALTLAAELTVDHAAHAAQLSRAIAELVPSV